MSYAICLNTEGYAASLEPRKLYELLPDNDAKARGMLRVVDESGEDYLYPAKMYQYKTPCVRVDLRRI